MTRASVIQANTSTSARSGERGTPWRIVAVDVGATTTRVRVEAAGGGDEPMSYEWGSRHLTAGGIETRRLVELVRAALGGLSEVPTALAIAIAGMPDLADPAEMLLSFRGLGVDRIVLVGDGVAAHVGALELMPGTVLAAGTGAVALATDFEDIWQRVDGWGHLLGDDGSGAWIGLSGLRAALRSVDGRPGGSEVLRTLAGERYGNLSRLVREVYTQPDRAAIVAAFARDVVGGAESGDEVSQQIVDDAAQSLAETALTAAKHGPPTAPIVAYTGGLFQAGQSLLHSMRRRIVAAGFELVPPAGTPLDGAATLAHLAATDIHQIPRHPRLIATIGEQA